MDSLSERAAEFIETGHYGDFKLIDPRWQLVRDMAQAIESLTEARVAASNKIEELELRIEELEAQVTALAPPKNVGPVVGAKWWDDCTPEEQQEIRDTLDGKVNDGS